MSEANHGNGNVLKVLLAVLSVLWAVTMLFLTTVVSDVKESTRLTTKHEADIGYIRENISFLRASQEAINEKLNVSVRGNFSQTTVEPPRAETSRDGWDPELWTFKRDVNGKQISPTATQ